MTIRQRFGLVHLEMQRLTPFPSQKPNSLFQNHLVQYVFQQELIFHRLQQQVCRLGETIQQGVSEL
jgi:hypothetical protein